jgi:hypothetical protein
MCRTHGWTKRSICSDRSSSPMAPGGWRTLIAARSTLRSRTATVGPAGGTRCGRCVSSAGASSPRPEPPSIAFLARRGILPLSCPRRRKEVMRWSAKRRWLPFASPRRSCWASFAGAREALPGARETLSFPGVFLSVVTGPLALGSSHRDRTHPPAGCSRSQAGASGGVAFPSPPHPAQGPKAAALQIRAGLDFLDHLTVSGALLIQRNRYDQ